MMRSVLFVLCLLITSSFSSHLPDVFQVNDFIPGLDSRCPVRTERAVCRMQRNPSLESGFAVSGEVLMTQSSNCWNPGPVRFSLALQGLPADGRRTLHGFHVHRNASFSEGCESFGPHYNPFGNLHGSPWPAALVRRHVGDLPNVRKTANGMIRSEFIAPRGVTLIGNKSIVGRGLVIHANPDDYGRGGNGESLTTGNVGTRLACCVIERY